MAKSIALPVCHLFLQCGCQLYVDYPEKYKNKNKSDTRYTLTEQHTPAHTHSTHALNYEI